MARVTIVEMVGDAEITTAEDEEVMDHLVAGTNDPTAMEGAGIKMADTVSSSNMAASNLQQVMHRVRYKRHQEVKTTVLNGQHTMRKVEQQILTQLTVATMRTCNMLPTTNNMVFQLRVLLPARQALRCLQVANPMAKLHLHHLLPADMMHKRIHHLLLQGDMMRKLINHHRRHQAPQVAIAQFLHLLGCEHHGRVE